MIKVWLTYNLLEKAVDTAFDKAIANFSKRTGIYMDKFNVGDTFHYIVLDTFIEMIDGTVIENVTLTLRDVLIENILQYNMMMQVDAPYSKLEFKSKSDRDLQMTYGHEIDSQMRINSDTSIVIDAGMSWCIDPREIISIKKT